MQESLLVEDVIPSLVSDNVNNLLTMLPSKEEIKTAVFDLNKDGAPGPDGFGAFFYQTYWDIIQNDVVSAVLQFFSYGWILPNFNSNTMILIPKNESADTIDQFRPIALANFKFKIISEVLADRLAQILPSIISKEQRGFIHGRNIKDCIGLTYEAINLLHKKSFGGNLAMKIDISKAFDTLNWSFLLKVLKQFGFNNKFCSWIEAILNSAHVSISINGAQHGYFKCRRGVRQGDPLSPLLFCLAEEVLSRGISKLVIDGKVDLIKSSRNTYIPSHCLYADDIMVFCRGKLSCIQAFKNLFTEYANCSGQIINVSKSTLYSGGISQVRLAHIANLIGFNIGSLPFIYLGVPIFKGKPKTRYFYPIADRIKSKLSAWKASLLSIAGRVQLVKSVIQSMLVYSISVYSWPVSILKSIETWTRNFIWSGDINQKKLVTVSWKRVCLPPDEGGLGLRSLISINEATNLKLCWALLNSNEDWAVILRSRVIRGHHAINHHIYSSLWSSIKAELSTIKDNSCWKVGSGQQINLWYDAWCGIPLAQSLNIQHNVVTWLPQKVSEIILNQQWHIPSVLNLLFPNLRSMVQHIILPVEITSDQLCWNESPSGQIFMKQAYEFKRRRCTSKHWAKSIWCKDIPPSKSLLVWRLMHDKVPTDEKLMEKGCSMPSMCSLCHDHSETTFHIFFECKFARNLWCWLTTILNLTLQFQSMDDIWHLCDNGWSPQCKITIKAALINLLNAIWFARNNARFNNKVTHWKSAVTWIISSTSLAGNISSCVSSSSMRDFMILKCFNVKLHPPNPLVIKEVIWQPPLEHWVKCNTDGAFNNHKSSCGGIFRNHKAESLCCFAENIGLKSAFMAELCGAMTAIEIANSRNWKNLWLETHSTLVVMAFKSSELVPWELSNKWMNCNLLTRNMNFVVSHVYREGN
ncbi:unnamed protein product [Trifolium pratense]|uniref:Uncharacterized protein n=1 Tax=Trifolium pratense TaxID=57577 RepID=A0ACB0K4B4_TRIPR|nr:unnamed protein product [Trifolium pratense]